MGSRLRARAISLLGLGLLITSVGVSCGSKNAATDPLDGSSPAGDGAPTGSDGSNGSDGSVGPVPSVGASVLQRGNDIYRRATYVQPALTVAAVTAMAPDTTFNTNATFPANGMTTTQGQASVLYLESGPAQAGCPTGATGCTATTRAAGAGVFFAFPPLGSNPNIVAFDETTGSPVWTAHVGTGGDGIRGTPVVDPDSRRVYVVTGGDPHVVRAISVDDGTEVTTGGWPVTLSATTLTASGQTFNSRDQNQRGALLLLNHILYIPFGGHFGDGGNYRGWIVAVDTADPTHFVGWTTQSARSGIWGSGGLASDGTYVFATTGDVKNVARSASDSEEVLRVQGMAEFKRDPASVFVPTESPAWDATDFDFGASTPAFVPLPAGSNPPSLLVAPAKAGRLYVLDGSNLSSGTYPATGGELANLIVANPASESMYTSPTIYTSASGLHAVINAGDGAKTYCPGGGPDSQEMIISVLLQPGKTPIATEVWCAANAGGRKLNYPPISTTTDDAGGNAIVWFMSGGQLTAVDGDTGQKLVTTTGASCDMVPSMSFPIAVKNRIVVFALGHLCSWSIDGK